MKRATTISISIVVLALLSGCTARSLSVLQTEFNAAVEARATCPPEEAYEPAAASNCSVDYQTIFSDIAAQAEKSLNEYKGGPAVKIGLHRLHAYSLWQSGATEKTVAQAARKGLSACDGDNYARAPRDCALLATIGSLKGVEAVGTEIGEMHKKFADATDKSTICSQSTEGWRKTASDYWQTYYLPLAKDMSTFAAKSETPDSVLKYLQKQHEAAFDQLKKLKNIGRQCVIDDSVAKQLIACPCNPALRTNEDIEACNKVWELYLGHWHPICISDKRSFFQA